MFICRSIHTIEVLKTIKNLKNYNFLRNSRQTSQRKYNFNRRERRKMAFLFFSFAFTFQQRNKMDMFYKMCKSMLGSFKSL